MSRKFTATVAGATFFLILISVFSKGIGFIREVLFASRFGVTESFDLYLIAAIIPIIINTSLYYIGQNYFIPLYNKGTAAGENKNVILGKNFWLFTFWGILISAALIILADPILNLYIGSSYLKNPELIRNTFNIIALSIPFGAASAILSAYINAEFEFKIPAYSQVILNLSIVLAVYIFSDQLFIYTIPIGYFTGNFLQLVFLLVYIKTRKDISLKFSRKNLSVKLKPDKIIFSIIAIEILGQFYLMIDRWFYPVVDRGSIAALNYAGNLFSLPISLISVSFAVVLFPFFSKTISSENEEYYRTKVSESLRINNLIFIPIFIVILIFGESIIKLIYERGRFTHSDTILTTGVLQYLSAGIIFFSGYSVLNKSLFASGKVKSLLLISISAIILKIVSSILLVHYLKQNGLALSTTLVYLYFFSCSLVIILKSGKSILSLFLHLIFYLLIAIFLIAVISVIAPLFNAMTIPVITLIICLYFVLYLLAVYIIDVQYIRRLNPLTRDKK